MSGQTILTLVLAYKYAVLIPIALLAGFPTGMAAGVAIRLGYLIFIPAYGCIMIGELIGDVAWYWIGYRWGETFIRTFGTFVGVTEESIFRAKGLFRKYDQRILISSKLTTGLGFAIPILFTAGMTRMPFYRYMRVNVTGQFLWSGGLIAIGYFFSDLYLGLDTAFERASSVSLFLITMLCLVGFARYIWSRIIALN